MKRLLCFIILIIFCGKAFPQTFTNYTTTNTGTVGLINPNIESLKFINDTLWIGTQNGLSILYNE